MGDGSGVSVNIHEIIKKRSSAVAKRAHDVVSLKILL